MVGVFSFMMKIKRKCAIMCGKTNARNLSYGIVRRFEVS